MRSPRGSLAQALCLETRRGLLTFCPPPRQNLYQMEAGSFMQNISSLRLFVLTLPVLVVAHQILSFLVPAVVRLLVPDSLRLILGLF